MNDVQTNLVTNSVMLARPMWCSFSHAWYPYPKMFRGGTQGDSPCAWHVRYPHVMFVHLEDWAATLSVGDATVISWGGQCSRSQKYTGLVHTTMTPEDMCGALSVWSGKAQWLLLVG